MSIPIYYATGNRWKAFSWAPYRALTEPLRALFAYVLLLDRMNDGVFGLVFGLVGGMMVNISIKELLPSPTRRKSDTTDELCHCGDAIMALSLVLFKL